MIQGWLVSMSDWAAGVSATYGIDPRVLLALVLLSLPPYYVGIAWAIRRVWVVRRASGGRLLCDGRFIAAISIHLVAWALPYAYVLIWGKGLPLWVWALLGTLVTLGLRAAFGRLHHTRGVADEPDRAEL